MTKHGESIEVNFGINLPVNVCPNTDCTAEFVLLRRMSNGEVWEQVGNKLGRLQCPYCGTEVGVGDSDNS